MIINEEKTINLEILHARIKRQTNNDDDCFLVNIFSNNDQSYYKIKHRTSGKIMWKKKIYIYMYII